MGSLPPSPNEILGEAQGTLVGAGLAGAVSLWPMPSAASLYLNFAEWQKQQAGDNNDSKLETCPVKSAVKYSSRLTPAIPYHKHPGPGGISGKLGLTCVTLPGAILVS